MSGEERRAQILKLLKENESPIIAKDLGEKFSVSRQCIVTDITILKATGEKIYASSKGYFLEARNKKEFKVVCKHDNDFMEKELLTIINNGGEVVNVIVDHPLYGEFTGTLNLKNKYDVDEFMEKVKDKSAHPLTSLTKGVHIHTISYENPREKERILKELKHIGVLLT